MYEQTFPVAVNNVPKRLDISDLQSAMEKYGAVSRVYMDRENQTVAWVHFEDKKAVRDA